MGEAHGASMSAAASNNLTKTKTQKRSRRKAKKKDRSRLDAADGQVQFAYLCCLNESTLCLPCYHFVLF